ncbi:MAG: aspartate/glutamate racemase family protein, partial [Ilumatobacteraceae bacterium]
MKRIGLIGGMSWESSIEYERIINEEVRRRLGGVHSADLIIRSFDFADIEELQTRNDWASAGLLLADAARTLTQAGAELLVLCTNSMHRVFDAIAGATPVPVLHIADATAAAIGREGIGTVGLLGTRYTMELPFYRERLEDLHGIRVQIPDDDERTVIHDVIYDELVRGIVRDESRARYLTIIENMIDRGCEGIIAGCTEIELLVQPHLVSVPYFATARLHAVAAVDAA